MCFPRMQNSTLWVNNHYIKKQRSVFLSVTKLLLKRISEVKKTQVLDLTNQ